MPDVWAFFTTTKHRAKNVAKIVEGLKAQTYPPSHIIINCGTAAVLKEVGLQLQNISSRGKSKVSKADEDNDVQVSKAFLADIGPGTKYPSGELLDQIPDGAYVYIGDDDQFYHKETIALLIESMQAEPEAAHGRMVRPKGDMAPGHITECGDLELEFPLAYAYAGWMLKKEMLVGMHEFFEALIKVQPKCKFTDDMWVSGYLARSGVEIKAVENENGKQIIPKGKEVGNREENEALIVTHDRGCENKACQKAIVKIKYPFGK